MTNEDALNWLAARAADAPVTIRTANVDRQVYQTTVELLAKAITELETLKKGQNDKKPD